LEYSNLQTAKCRLDGIKGDIKKWEGLVWYAEVVWKAVKKNIWKSRYHQRYHKKKKG
jgi:hypothetical protein